MNRQYILIAEDDTDISELMKLYLESEGFGVICAGNGIEALELARRYSPVMGIFDIMMPQMSGLELIKELRETSNMPVMIVSAKDRDYDKILGLNIGADDYMTKPFNPLELVARVKALLRRAGNSSDIIRAGELQLNLTNSTVTKNDIAIPLTPMEFKILLKMVKSPGRIFTKIQLYESVCGEYFESDDNTIMVHISRIREKIEDDPKNPKHIVTVRGVGYKFEE